MIVRPHICTTLLTSLLVLLIASVAQAQGFVTADQLLGTWETDNVNKPYDEIDPSLSITFNPDGTVLSDPDTERECVATWQLDGNQIITTVVTNDNKRFVDTVIGFDASDQSMTLQSEPYNNHVFYLRRAGALASEEQNAPPLKLLIHEFKAQQGPNNFVGSAYFTIKSRPNKVFRYEFVSRGGNLELSQIEGWSVKDMTEARATARKPKSVNELSMVLISPFAQVIAGETEFVDTFKSVAPTFKEWVAKARQLQPEPFSKRMVGEPGKQGLIGTQNVKGKGYAFDFVWTKDKPPKLVAYRSVGPFGELIGGVHMSEDQVLDLDAALSNQDKVLAQVKNLAAGQAAENQKQRQIIDANFTMGSSATAAANPPSPNVTATTRYRAQIGDHDLRNSKGVFLPDIAEIKARDILLQDRFNYHQKNIRDPQDTDEGVYQEGKETLRKLFESKIARLSDGGDPMPLLLLGQVVDVTVTDSDIIVTPVSD